MKKMFKKFCFYFLQNTKHLICFFFSITWFLRGREESKNDALSKLVNNIFFLRITLINNLSFVNASSVSVFVLSNDYSY